MRGSILPHNKIDCPRINDYNDNGHMDRSRDISRPTYGHCDKSFFPQDP